MLRVRTVLSRDGLRIEDVQCWGDHGRGDTTELAGASAMVFVRRGCFTRSADGSEAVLDPTLAYCLRPGQEQRYDHPHRDGDDCTAMHLDEPLLVSLYGGDPLLPPGPLSTSPGIDLLHRMLLCSARRAEDELFERAVGLLAATLEQADPRRMGSAKPTTAHARKTLTEGAREALTSAPGRSLPKLAHQLGVSPHHLSRVFRSQTGHTISRHRMRVRTRLALEQLAEGHQDLARLSVELGFADQSHLCRVTLLCRVNSAGR